MPQISRKKLPKETENQVYESFFKTIELLGKKESRAFLDDLLTKTERIMLAKRLAIAILLLKDWSLRDIKGELNVSQTTVANIAKTLEFSAGYRRAVSKLKNSEKWGEFWQGLERLHYRNVKPGAAFLPEEEIRGKLGRKKKTLV